MARRRKAGAGTNPSHRDSGKLSLPSEAGSLPPLWRRYLPQVIILLSGIAVYTNTFSNPFIFDDKSAILDNPNIRSLWPITRALTGPEQSSVAGRPLVNFSLALNYAAGGLNVGGYHAVNLAIHLISALLLFGLIRRTCQTPRFRDKFGAHATATAFTCSLIWIVHPLQTESVTYIVQRAESMMGMFLLGTLYSFVRHLDSARGKLWLAGSALACAIGMGTKEVMAVTPILVLAYDYVFADERPAEAMRRRWGYYLAIFAGWGIMAALILSGPRDQSAGFGLKGITPVEYARTQFEIICHYLRLCFWPRPLVLDYMWPPAKGWGEIIPSAICVLGLLGAAVVAFIRRSPLGFVGVCFFVILAPSSSFIPIADLAFEHRMYLPLASVVIASVLIGDRLFLRCGEGLALSEEALRMGRSVLVGVIAVALGGVTLARNYDYRSELAIYEDSVRKRPGNHRAHSNLGFILNKMGRNIEAEKELREAIAIKPDFVEAQYNLGNILSDLGKIEEAGEHYREAIRLKPGYAEAHNNLGSILADQGRMEEARAEIETALKFWPDYPDALNNLGTVLAQQGQHTEAVEQFRRALAVNPRYAQAHRNLARALDELGEWEEGRRHFVEALEIEPADAVGHNNFAAALARHGDLQGALDHLTTALQIDPNYIDAQRNMRLVKAAMRGGIPPGNK